MEDGPRVLSDDEYNRDWHPIRDRLIWHRHERDSRPFRDSSWVIALIPSTPFELSPLSWIRRDWTIEVDDYAPLLETLRDRQVHQVCIKGLIDPPRLVSPEREAIQSHYFAYEFSVFSMDGDWCIVGDSIDNQFCLLGGTPEFMEDYFHHAGGLETIKRRFRDFDLGSGWDYMGWYWRDMADAEDRRLAVYALAGWEPPPYPNQGEPRRRLADVAEGDKRWRPVFERIFGTVAAEEGRPFTDPGWRVVGLAGHLIAEGGRRRPADVDAPDLCASPDYCALFYELLLRDSWEIGIHRLDAPEDWSRTVVSTPFADAIRNSDDLLPLAGLGIAAFGPEGDWGLVSFADGSTMLGGAPDLMDRIIARAGGVAAIRCRFNTWAAMEPVPSNATKVRRVAGWV